MNKARNIHTGIRKDCFRWFPDLVYISQKDLNANTMNIVISMSIRRKKERPRKKPLVIIMNATAILSVTFSSADQRSITAMITNAGISENRDKRSIECLPRRSLHSITIQR